MIPILNTQNNPKSNSSSYPGRNRGWNYTKLSYKMYMHKLKICSLSQGTMQIVLVDCTLYLVWCWFPYLEDAELAKLQLAWLRVACC